MPDELTKVASEAAGTLSQTQWGALLVISWLIFGVVVWFLRKDLQREQVAHQATREEYVGVLKGKDQLAAGLLTLQDGQKSIADEQNRVVGLLIEALSNRRAG